MALSTPTRDRIIDAAMQLFSQNGYRGTSVAHIEAAAGLMPGSGGLYHHFRTKEEVLAAGIERHLSRLRALRDIRAILTGLGDPRSELAIIGRYALAELDREADLLHILATEARTHPHLAGSAADQLFGATAAEFSAWIDDQSGNRLPPETAKAVALLGLGALLCSRVLPLLGMTPVTVDDQTLISTWSAMILSVIATGAAPDAGRDA